ncbi:amidohydrolase family protein [Blastococcus sp. KM273128]|uniref:amidohydrolase family protein n=1 Tax=Blastococcus sp. KM273128 TaxID=2570314 RepID=UPI001F34A6DD|nr:amidohydrolase family protein [Blastococcus sp. KM273128]
MTTTAPEEVVDFHARVLPSAAAVTRLLAEMDRHGIARAVVVAAGAVDLDTLATQIMEGGFVDVDADNAGLLAVCAESGGRLLPMFFGNPHRPPSEYARVAAGCYGLELSPAVHGVALTDERTRAWVEVAGRHGHPVYVVCLGRPGTTAADLAVLAREFPDTDFVLGHCGFVGIDVWSVERIRDSPNVFAETSGCYTRTAAAAVARLGADRVLFGTEWPLQDPRVELAKIAALDLEPDDRRRVLSTNADRLLRRSS